MKLETRTFDLYAEVLAIAFATVIHLCAPFRCQPCFHMSNSLIGLLLEVYIPSCNVKPQLVRTKKLKRFKSKSRCYCHCSAALLSCFDSKLVFKQGNHSLVGNKNTILQYATSVSACGANAGLGLGLCSTKGANLKHKSNKLKR